MSLRRMSRTWETVKSAVPLNSSLKLDQTGSDGKGIKQLKCLITLYIVGWVIMIAKNFVS